MLRAAQRKALEDAERRAADAEARAAVRKAAIEARMAAQQEKIAKAAAEREAREAALQEYKLRLKKCASCFLQTTHHLPHCQQWRRQQWRQRECEVRFTCLLCALAEHCPAVAIRVCRATHLLCTFSMLGLYSDRVATIHRGAGRAYCT